MPAKTSSSKSITVSIVSHGQQALILPLLEQLNRMSGPWVDKVVLTVNVPETRLVTGQQDGLPIEWIQNQGPKGFGANHNAAFERCRTDWFLILNPDIRFDADVLRPLLAQAGTDTGVLTTRIVEPGKNLPEPHRAMLTPCELWSRHRPGYRAPAHPAWIPGMFMLFSAAAYRQIGGFDTRFHMYCEDFDICARLRLSGWQIQVLEELRVLHEAQRASRRNWRHLGWHIASFLRLWRSDAFWRYRAMWARPS